MSFILVVKLQAIKNEIVTLPDGVYWHEDYDCYSLLEVEQHQLYQYAAIELQNNR